MNATGYLWRGERHSSAWAMVTSVCLVAALTLGSMVVHSEVHEPAPPVAASELRVASHPAQPLHVEGLDLVKHPRCWGCLQRSRYQGAELAAPRALPYPLRLDASVALVSQGTRSGAALVPASRGPPTV